MNQGVLQQSSPVQQMIAAAGGNPNLWSINTMRPPTTQTPPYLSSPLPPPPAHPNFFPSSLLLPINPSWLDHHQQLPESWNQLFLGGLVGGGSEFEDKANLNHFDHAKQLDNNWEEEEEEEKEDQDFLHKVSSGISAAAFVDVKQEIYGGHANHHHQDFQAVTKPSWSPHHQVIMSVSPPMSSCVTTSFSNNTTTTNNNIMDFSSKKSGRRDSPLEQSSYEVK